MDTFLAKLVKFFLYIRINVRPLTPHIMPRKTHKMAIVSWRQIVWRHFRAYSKRVPALIVHSELKSVHPGFPVTFIFKAQVN